MAIGSKSYSRITVSMDKKLLAKVKRKGLQYGWKARSGYLSHAIEAALVGWLEGEPDGVVDEVRRKP